MLKTSTYGRELIQEVSKQMTTGCDQASQPARTLVQFGYFTYALTIVVKATTTVKRQSSKSISTQISGSAILLTNYKSPSQQRPQKRQSTKRESKKSIGMQVAGSFGSAISLTSFKQLSQERQQKRQQSNSQAIVEQVNWHANRWLA